jgi:hypothetical protein
LTPEAGSPKLSISLQDASVANDRGTRPVAVRVGRGEFVLLGLLLIAGAAVCLYYGRMGFMPLDHSIVFDGAWRVLNGQIPWRDFNLPNGLTPILFQAALFKLLGVSWFSYVLHAALFNGLFCVLGYLMLRLLGGAPLTAFFYALITAIVMYPPLGGPYLEQHGFFFVLLAIVLGLAAPRARSGFARDLFWLMIPPALALGFLSKQIPTVFGIALVGFILILTPRRLRRRGLVMNAASVIALALLLVAAARLFQIDSGLWQLYYYRLPSALGRERMIELLQDGPKFVDRTLWPFGHVIVTPDGDAERMTSYSSYVLLLAGLAWLPFLVPSRLGRRFPGLSELSRGYRFEMTILTGLTLTWWLTAALTDNLQEETMPYVFLAMGILHLLVQRTFPEPPVAEPLAPAAERRLISVRAAQLALIAVSGLEAFNFNSRVNVTRIVHDFVYQRKAVAGRLPPEFSFMAWGVPSHYRFTPQDISDLVGYLRRQDRNFLYVGDASIVYALAGRPSVNPSLWFHPGLTIPEVGTGDFERYQDQLLSNIRRFRVGFVVQEGEHAWLENRLSDFDRLTALMKQYPGRDTQFGAALTVTELPLPSGPDPGR